MLLVQTLRPPAPQAAGARLAVPLSQAALGFLLAGLGPCLILLARDLDVPRAGLSWVSAGFGAGLLLLGAVGERFLSLGTWRVLRISVAGLAAGALLPPPGPSCSPLSTR